VDKAVFGLDDTGNSDPYSGRIARVRRHPARCFPQRRLQQGPDRGRAAPAFDLVHPLLGNRAIGGDDADPQQRPAHIDGNDLWDVAYRLSTVL
jgi:hypothetical protein